MFGIERFFDRAKGVAVAAGAASLLAIGGVVTLAISAALTLEMWMPTQAVLAMLDLPVEVAKQIMKERPVAATVVIAGLGLLIARKPQVALGMVDKLIERVSGGNHHL